MASASIMLPSVFFFFFFMLTFILTNAQQNVTVHTYCGGGNFTSNSSYSLSLNRLISSLPDLTPTTNGFYNFSVGGEVNAIALCRGDLKPNQDCISCISNAAKQLLQNCPNIIEAFIWLEKCMFRYTSRTILGILEPVPFYHTSSNVNVSDKEGFSKGLGELLESLGAKIEASETRELKFAAGVRGTIYALVQCTPDVSESDCRICLSQIFAGVPTCCDGKTGGWWMNPNCYFRFEDYPFFDLSVIPEQRQPLTPHNNNDTRTSDQGDGKDRSKTLVFAVVPVVTTVLVLISLFICLVRKRKKKKKKNMKEEAETEIENADSFHFEFDAISVATDEFSLKNKIGEGGFGVVYKGRLEDGEEIAVKRLSIHSGQGNAEFKTEVLLMTKLQHKNLVKLLGFSIRESERLLVYEFIPNTSLDRFLFDPIKQKQLDWGKRYKIIVGISKGLLYLHEGTEFPIIHRDLKTSNVLLDEQMQPKISDFGMARQFDFDRTQAVTRRVVGTYGYMAPEYAMHGRFSVKTDVYGFGVLVLEIITGKRNSGFGFCEGTDLPTFAWKNWIEGTSTDLIDPVLLKSCYKKQSMQCLEIALSCVQENPTKRPTMESVVSMLSSDSESLQLPKPSQPGFFRSSTSFSISVNDVSLTDLSALTSIKFLHLSTLQRLISNSLQGIFYNRPYIRKQLRLPSIFRNLSVSSDSQLSSEKSSNAGLVTGGDIVKDGFLRWRNGGGTCHSSAVIDSSALVEFGAVIHEKAVVGAEVHVGSGTVIGPSVTINPSTRIGYNVSVSNCSIGESCVIHNGVCIGQDGFGFYVDEHGSMVKKPQTLKVKIGNRVEIGANTCIDRGSWRDTLIEDDTKIDNLVQIGHNVMIGKCCLLCGQVGIAGSVTIGDYVALGGRAAVRAHVSIVSKVRLAANSCVTRNITEPGDFGGFPAVPIHEWRKQIVQAQISNKRIT